MVAGIGGTALLASALAASYALGIGPWSGKVREHGPLDTGTSENINTDSANVGELISYGWLSVYNSGQEDIVLESAELIGPGAADGVVIRRPETVPVGDEIIAGERGYPPRFTDPPKPPPQPIAGTVVHPGDENGIELLFAIKPQREGRFEWPGVRVHYRVGDKKYVHTDPDDMYVLCVPRVESCPFPEGWEKK